MFTIDDESAGTKKEKEPVLVDARRFNIMVITLKMHSMFASLIIVFSPFDSLYIDRKIKGTVITNPGVLVK